MDHEVALSFGLKNQLTGGVYSSSSHHPQKKNGDAIATVACVSPFVQGCPANTNIAKIRERGWVVFLASVHRLLVSTREKMPSID